MAQDYNFTFTNLNTTPSGWTGNTIVNSPANQAPPPTATTNSLYNNPFDLVDPNQAVLDTTANNPTGKGVEAANLKDAQSLLARNTTLLKNLEKRARLSESADMLNQANQEIADAMKEQARIQKQVDAFKATTKTPQQLRHEAQLAAQAAAQKATLTKQIENQHNALGKFQTKVDAHTHSIDALKAAIGTTQDPRVLDQLNKKLANEQKKFSNEQKQLTAQNSHITQLQTRLLALNGPTPPAPGTPLPPTPAPGTTAPAPGGGTTTPAPGTTTPAPGTPGSTAPKQLNFWDELVDKKLGSRKGASGWHSDGGLPTNVPVVTPPVAPAPVVPTAPVTPTPGTPGTTPTPAPTRALTAQELQWRAKFDPRGWANSADIPTPVITPPAPAVVTGVFGGAAKTTPIAKPIVAGPVKGWS